MIAGTILYFIISCNAYHFQFRKQGYSEEASKAMAIEAGQELFPAGNMKQSLLLSARIPETWILVIAYFVTFGGFMALTAWVAYLLAEGTRTFGYTSRTLHPGLRLPGSLVTYSGGNLPIR
jgi:NNP family nitrate/nitrite transporter-like MFS transporter